MRFWPTLCRIGGRFCLVCVGRLLLWSFWLFLCIVLGMGIWVASTPQLNIPKPLLRRLESHLSAEGLEVRVGGIVISPNGQLLVSDLRLHLAGFEDPILRIEHARTTVNPWAMLAGRAGAHSLEFSGADLVLPAQISPTGTSQPLLEDIDAHLSYGDHRLDIHRLNARSAGLSLRASGALNDSSLRHNPAAPREPLGPQLLAYLRQAATLYPKLRPLGKCWLELDLRPDAACIALATAKAGLSEYRLEAPGPIEAGSLTLACTPVPLRPRAPFALELRAGLARLSTPKASAEGLRALLRARIDPAAPAASRVTPLNLELSATRVSNQWIPLEGPSLLVTPPEGLSLAALLPKAAPGSSTPPSADRPASAAAAAPAVTAASAKEGDLRLDLALSAAGNLASLRGTARLPEASAELDTRCELDSNLVAAIGTLLGRDLLRFCNPRERGVVDGHVSVAPGGRLRLAEGWVAANSLDVYKVAIGHVSGHVSWDGTNFRATQALMRLGENFARGSYEMNARNKDFRFLLSGQLRPTVISPWFKGWWSPFWENFDFTPQSPTADIDIHGRWGVVPRTVVFVGVDATRASLRGVTMDRARTTLFIRPTLVHALDIELWRPEGQSRVWFTRATDPERALWTRIEFGAEAQMDTVQAATLLSPATAALASHFIFEKAPKAKAHGWFNGPGAPGGLARHVEFEVNSTGTFHLVQFPLADACFTGVWEGPEVRLHTLSATAAGGKLTGETRFDTEGDAHRIDFKGTLTAATLGRALNDVEGHMALLAGNKFLPTADRLPGTFITLNATASGAYDKPLSFHGTGSAHVWGEELAKVRLLGGLSQVLGFTSLRFTSAKAQFQLEGPKVRFPTVRLMGRNSAIAAYGNFNLETRALDFKAKVWPFDQTPGLLQSAMGLVLSPFSHAFEVKLSGNLANPSWAFVYNPFRALASPGTQEPQAPASSVPQPAPAPASEDSSQSQPPAGAH